jgi:hypothetical protein
MAHRLLFALASVAGPQASATDVYPSGSASPSESVSPTPPVSPSPSVSPSTPPAADGCTPGYWKTHPEAWPIPTTTTVDDVFDGAGSFSGTTLLAALSLQGGSGISGATETLLRAGTAAYLNSLSVDFAYTRRRSSA